MYNRYDVLKRSLYFYILFRAKTARIVQIIKDKRCESVLSYCIVGKVTFMSVCSSFVGNPSLRSKSVANLIQQDASDDSMVLPPPDYTDSPVRRNSTRSVTHAYVPPSNNTVSRPVYTSNLQGYFNKCKTVCSAAVSLHKKRRLPLQCKSDVEMSGSHSCTILKNCWFYIFSKRDRYKSFLHRIFSLLV